MYDVVIVGGRCAGASVAMLLAQAGHEVLIVDRATFPSDTMSTHFVQSPGMARLYEWGLIDSVFASDCPPIRSGFFDVGGETMEMEIPLHEPLPGLASPRRFILDKILIDAAVAAGAHLAEGVSVDSLMRDGERVVGIRGHTSEGAFEARARLVVGADGRHSVVARETAAGFLRFVPPVTSGYYSYFKDTGVDGTELYFHDDLMCVIFPTNHGLTTVGLIWPHARFTEIRRDIERNFDRGLQRLGERASRVRVSERADRFVGTAELANYVRQAWGPGWALVGDACYHKDPLAADGITDAFRGAELLAAALHDSLSGERPEDAALAGYEQKQMEFIERHFDAAVGAANFERSPQERSAAFFESRLHDFEEVEALLQEGREEGS